MFFDAAAVYGVSLVLFYCRHLCRNDDTDGPEWCWWWSTVARWAFNVVLVRQNLKFNSCIFVRYCLNRLLKRDRGNSVSWPTNGSVILSSPNSCFAVALWLAGSAPPTRWNCRVASRRVGDVKFQLIDTVGYRRCRLSPIQFIAPDATKLDNFSQFGGAIELGIRLLLFVMHVSLPCAYYTA